MEVLPSLQVLNEQIWLWISNFDIVLDQTLLIVKFVVKSQGCQVTLF